MLALRRGRVVRAGAGRLEADGVETGRAGPGGEQPLVVELADGRHPAVADVGLVGACREGDEVIVNVAARELGLGSGGFDIVHVNLTRGLSGAGPAGAAVMKLNYSSLQHAAAPLEAARPLRRPTGTAVVIALHGQLAPLAWALAGARAAVRVGYVQTAGGALPGSRSRVVGELLARGLLAGHLTAGPCYGGADGETVTAIGAIDHGLTELGWELAVCGPGPGIIGSASTLGHGGMAALDSAHAALCLGAPTLIVPRMSSSDPRPRHRGISHHTRTVLELLLAPVTVALPAGVEPPPWGTAHRWVGGEADLEGYAASGLPVRTMGRTMAEDPLFFAAALAAGAVAAARA
ncbi:MAG: hypothetical protein QOF77_1186 [Solirubrobacteraceae bacterium]|nr:hypothetical protein [Solirubrobacteraceae bacterium]